MSAKPERFEYVIDANDVIVEINEAWTAFAEENDGEGLGRTVVGTWLWQHLAGLEVKHLFRVLLEKVRENQEPVQVPFRCDAPELRRSMMLELTPLEGHSVRFSSWILEEEERPPVELLRANREVIQDSERVRMCAWCKRIGAGVGDWRDLEDALLEIELFQHDPLPRVIHAVCPDCQSMMLRKLAEAP